MRYPAEHKDETRAHILAEAAKQIRAHGPNGIGVAEIMKRAGLTHGGFYAHFKSKDALVAAAIEKMFESAQLRWETETAGKNPGAGIHSYIAFYLSEDHRDARATGCPIAALSSDMPRLTAASKKAYAGGARRLTARLAAKLAELGHADSEVLAASVLAELVGALALARVEPDAERSRAILAASKRALAARLHL